MRATKGAKFWCLLNGWRMPKLYGVGESAEDFDVAFAVVEALAGDEGRALWRLRLWLGQDPVTGRKVSSSRLAPRTQVTAK